MRHAKRLVNASIVRIVMLDNALLNVDSEPNDGLLSSSCRQRRGYVSPMQGEGKRGERLDQPPRGHSVTRMTNSALTFEQVFNDSILNSICLFDIASC